MSFQKGIYLSDTHCPKHDEKALQWAIKQIRDYQPNYLIHGGDLLEAASASRWDNEEDFSLKDEFTSANEVLIRLREAAPKAELLFLPGNHDYNVISINRIDKNLRGLCDWRERHNLPELYDNWKTACSYEYNPKRGTIRLGQITLSHGYEANSSSDEMQGYILGVPYGLFVSGHTHKPVQVSQAMKTKTVPLPYWYCNAGCLSDMRPEWIRRRRTNLWGQGLVKFEFLNTKGARYSRCWEANVEVFRMKQDI